MISLKKQTLLLAIFLGSTIICSSNTINGGEITLSDTNQANEANQIVSQLVRDNDAMLGIRTDTLVKVKINPQEKNIKIFTQTSSTKNWFKEILPIFTLLLGFFIKGGVDYIALRKKTKKIGKRWRTELELLNQPLSRQISEIKNTIAESSLDHLNPPKLVIIAALNCENFESLDKTELLTYINRFHLKDYKEAVSLAGKISLLISIIEGNNQSLKGRFRIDVENSAKKYEKLNSNFQQLNHSLHEYKTQIINSEGREALAGSKFKVLDELYGMEVLPHIEDGVFEYDKLERDYLSPMINELERLSADERTGEMIVSTRRCLDDVAGIKMELRYFTSNMTNHIGYFEENVKALSEILLELN